MNTIVCFATAKSGVASHGVVLITPTLMDLLANAQANAVHVAPSNALSWFSRRTARELSVPKGYFQIAGGKVVFAGGANGVKRYRSIPIDLADLSNALAANTDVLCVGDVLHPTISWSTFEAAYKPAWKDGEDLLSRYDLAPYAVNTLWSMVEGESDTWTLVPGVRLVNVLGFVATERPWSHDGVNIEY